MYENAKLGRYVLLLGWCAGAVSLVFLQYASAQYAMDEKPAMKMDSVMSPIMQVSQGVAPEKVQCRDGMQLVFKSSNNMPACVKPTSVQRLMQIGWAKSLDMMTIPSGSTYTLDLNAAEEDEKYLWTN